MVEPSDTPEQPGGGTSGFEKADKAMNVAGRAASAVGTGIVKLWGLIILAAGIAIIAILPEAWWAVCLLLCTAYTWFGQAETSGSFTRRRPWTGFGDFSSWWPASQVHGCGLHSVNGSRIEQKRTGVAELADHQSEDPLLGGVRHLV